MTVSHIEWQEAGELRSSLWRSENGSPPPKRVIVADDTLKADVAYRLACEGTALLWRGDFQNARQLVQAMARRAERKPRKAPTSALEAFNFERQAQSQRARTLGMLVLQFEDDYSLRNGRAPDVRQACLEAYGPANGKSVGSLRELLGVIGAHEWRKKGVPVAVLQDRIHPYYGVFAPIRAEYLGLVAHAPLSERTLAFDIGTGTGVLAALLIRRGVTRVIATDNSPRALACARDNMARLNMTRQVEVIEADLFPPGQAPLIVCNPPWIPARPSSVLEHAVYDPDSRMLRGFIFGLARHLTPGGEGWLILSDLAEHLGLRTHAQLLAWFDEAQLVVKEKLDVRANHPRAKDAEDPLHGVRSKEMTSLWRLRAATPAVAKESA